MSIVRYIKTGTSQAPLGFVLVLLFALEVLTGGYFGLWQPEAFSSDAITLASIAKEFCIAAVSLPQAWFFVLVGMTGLLIGNFAWALSTKERIEWVPEASYVFLAICTWFFIDECFLASWFPLVLIKASLLIFAIYLFLLDRKNQPM